MTNRRFKDPREGKLEFEDWKNHYINEIFYKFKEDYQEEILDNVKIWAYAKSFDKPFNLEENLEYHLKDSLQAQYQQYLDTEEFDSNKVGCSGHGEDR